MKIITTIKAFKFGVLLNFVMGLFFLTQSIGGISQDLNKNGGTDNSRAGYPPTWNPVVATQNSAILAVYTTANPRINNILINPGDYIGVFYLDNNGQLQCGGADYWQDTQNIVFAVWGDDGSTPAKDGFAYGELFRFKIFSWTTQKTYDVDIVNFDPQYPYANWYPLGISFVTNMQCLETFDVYATANPNPVCLGNPVSLAANTFIGTTGNYTYSWTSNPAGFTSNLQNPTVTPSVNTTYLLVASDGTNTSNHSVSVVVNQNPEANAGPDATICANQTVQLSGSASNYSAFLWSTSGNGTFSNAGIFNPVYTPGTTDKTNGAATLTLTAQPPGGCTVIASDPMVLTVLPLPTVNAGSDRTLCKGSEVLLNASAQNYSTIQWTTSGSGTFSSTTILNPQYFPSTADLTAGNFTLTITVNATTQCTGTASSQTKITLVAPPTAGNGITKTICEANTVAVSGTISNYSSSLWVTNGDGTFNDPTQISVIYTPGVNDKINGTAILTLYAYPVAPCTVPATQQATVNIKKLPVIDAGNTDKVCLSQNLQLVASASFANSYLWTTSGTGVFSSSTILNPIYYPSTSDYNSGIFTLKLRAGGVVPCQSYFMYDSVIVTVVGPPTVQITTTSNQTICTAPPLQLNATATNYDHLLWTTSGNGTFSNNAILNPVYTPGSNDVTGSPITFSLTAYAVVGCGANATHQISESFITGPSVSAGTNATVCQGSTHALSGTATNYSTVAWTTSGTGTFSSTSSLTATYTPSAADISAGSVTLTLTASAVSPCTTAASSSKTLTIQKTPTANAGTNATVCQGSTHTLSGSANNYGTLAWTTSGTGTFSSTSSLTATYTPSAADISAGSVTLTLTASAVSPCTTAASSSKTLTIQKTPTASAGTNATVCQGSTHTLSGSANNYGTLAWTTSGTGTFSSTSSLSAIYTPSTADINAGTVTLTLTASAVSPCTTAASSSKTLTIQKTPTANAGTNATVCQGSTHTLSGSASNYGALAWTTSGTGTFSSTSSLTAIYTPSTADINAGTVTLTLTASAVSPCTTAASSSKTLTIQKTPTANAGTNATVCQGGTHALSGSASNYGTLAWTTSGTGTFSSTSSLTAIYTPSTADITAGSVTLTLTASAISPCSTAASSSKTLTIQKTPTANAGTNATVCQGSTHTLSGSASNYGTLAWTTSGTGTFSSTSSLSAIYTPSTADINAGSVTLTLTASAVSPCTTAASSSKTLTIQKTPTANAGTNATVCQGSTHTLSGSANNYGTLAWTTSGTGTFSSTSSLSAIYTPSTADINAGSVTLTLTASAVSPCTTAASSSKTLTIQKAPTAFAGADATILDNQTFSISATASNYSSLQWTSSGNGTFSSTSSLTPVYTPGSADIQNATVVLTLTSNAFSPCTISSADALTLTIMQQQIIQLSSGWNSLSSFVLPLNQSFEQVMAPISNNLLFAQNMNQIYWPQYGINTIGNFDPAQGYLVKLSAASNLPITGFKSPNKTVQLTTGWNILPVISDVNVSSQLLISQLGNKLIIANEITGGGIIWPDQGVNTIPFLIPGKAYYIKVTSNCSFVYP